MTFLFVEIGGLDGIYMTYKLSNFVLFSQLNILEEGLLNHTAVGFGESGRKASELRILLAKIEESEVNFQFIQMVSIVSIIDS